MFHLLKSNEASKAIRKNAPLSDWGTWVIQVTQQ
ncbi:hypothetical protein EVA_21727, partial [gut metagenome]